MGKYKTSRPLDGEIEKIREISYGNTENFLILTVPNLVYKDGKAIKVEENIALHERKGSTTLQNLINDYIKKRSLKIRGDVETKLTLFRKRPRFFDYNVIITVDGKDKYKIRSRTVTPEMGYVNTFCRWDEFTQLEI
jgi:hypothetical protein